MICWGLKSWPTVRNKNQSKKKNENFFFFFLRTGTCQNTLDTAMATVSKALFFPKVGCRQRNKHCSDKRACVHLLMASWNLSQESGLIVQPSLKAERHKCRRIALAENTVLGCLESRIMKSHVVWESHKHPPESSCPILYKWATAWVALRNCSEPTPLEACAHSIATVCWLKGTLLSQH